MIKKISKINLILVKFIFMSVVILTVLVSCKKHKHDYKTSIVEPSCTAQGYTLHTCSCGDTYKDNYTQKVAHTYQNGFCTQCGIEAPHTHSYTTSIVEPSCTEEGYTLHTCSCGDSYKDNYTDKVAHTYQNGFCTQCGAKDPHTHSYTTSVVEPSCTEEGYTLHTCSCGDSYKDNYTDKVAHTYQNGFCTQCGAKDPHTHSYTTSVVEPSCTEEGYTLHTCSCGDSYKDNYTDKVAHTYQNGFCTQCGAKDPHTHSYTTSVVEPSCTEEGYTLHTCSCGDTYKDNYTEKVAHTYQNGFCIHCGEREIIEYDVTFVLNYKGATTEVHTTEKGLITFIPTREGYVFNGWWLSEGSIGDDYMLSTEYDITQPVTQSGLTLYAEWVEKPTEAHQLPVPNVSINNEVFSWKAVPNAQSYTIQIYPNGSSEVYFQQTIEDTQFLFDASSPAGYYKVLIRANGDGIHTVNSVYVSKYYAHHILGSVFNINLDMTTSVLSWSSVPYATEYELYINHQLIDTLNVTQYDLSSYEAGTYTIKIVAKADNYQSSITSQNIVKRRLLAPEVEVQLDPETVSYTFSWKDVAFANQYILNISGEEVKINDTIYTLDMTSTYWKNENIEISVQAFDTNADYLISTSSKTIEVTKKYTLKMNQNLEEAGKVSISKEGLYQTGDRITLEATTYKGYMFDGWYDGETLLSKDEIYSFSVSHQNMVYTAKWTYYTVTTVQNIQGAGYITTYDEKITEVGESITLDAVLYLGYVWEGWYDGETLLTTDFTYTFDMPSHSVTYMAKYTLQEDMADFIFTSYENKCTITGVVNKDIEEITVPGDVTSIQKGAFQKCEKLTKITLPFIGEALNGNSNTHFGYIFGASTYQVQQQYVPTSLKEVTILNGESIKEGSFYQCNQLTSIQLPAHLTSIGNNAFYQCSSLDSMTIPNQVSSIGDSAFYQCSHLLQVELPDTVTTLGDFAFYECYRLAQVTLSNQLTQIEEKTFYGCSNLNYNEDEYGKYLGNQDNPYLALINLKGREMTTIIVSEEAKLIRKGAFSYCSHLTSLILPFVGASLNGTTNTHFGYIFGASSHHQNGQFVPSTLQEVTITSGDCISPFSFMGCSHLTSIVMTADIVTIGASAMNGCTNLTTITLPSTIQKIETNAFSYTNVEHLYYSGTIEQWCNMNIQSAPFYDSYSASFQDISPSRHFYQLDENSQWNEVTSIEIPTSITEVGYDQFNGFHFVTHISIPSSVTKINDRAFANCIGLTELVIPNSVTEFGFMLLGASGCLYKCMNLEKLTIPFIGKTQDVIYDSGLAGFFDHQSVPASLKEVVITEGTTIPEGAFKNCHAITTIVIPESVITIGANAFSGCSQLADIVLPTSLIKIEEGAFSSCTSLKQMDIPDTVTEIGYAALRECTGLTHLTLPFVGDSMNESNNTHFGYIFGANTAEENTQYVPTSLTSVEITGGTVIKEKAFLACSSLVRLTIPHTLQTVEGKWIDQCSALVDVYFNGTIENWCNITLTNEYANPKVYVKHLYFLDEEKQYQELTTIEIPSTITSIGKYQFHHFDQLQEIILPNSIQTMQTSAFANCNQLEQVYYKGSIADWCRIYIVTSNANPMYYASLFHVYNENDTYDVLTSVEIPETITSIGSNQFYGFSQLTEIVLPSTITRIGPNAFSYCSSLTKINLPKMITQISSSTFEECSSLKEIMIPEGVTWISQNAFKGCSALERIVVPQTVTCIESAAFGGCTSLSSITLPFVGDGINGYNNMNFGYIFGAYNYTNNGKYVPTSLQEVIITGGTEIAEQAFYGCSSLTRVVIPETVTHIGLGAFAVCNNLTHITLPFIGESADGTMSTLFGHIFGAKISTDRRVPSSLKEVVITNGTRVYDIAFINSSSIERIVLPETIESIGVSAFSGCAKLTNIVMHQNITTIEKNAFYNCISLENVYYQGTIEDWCYISFATNDANPMHYATHFYYSDDNSTYQELIELEIPSTITTIGSYQFGGFSSLASVFVPDTVIKIDGNAFAGCSHLEKMTLPFVGITSKNQNETWQYPLGVIFGRTEYVGSIATAQTYYGESLTKTRTETFYIPATLKQVTITGGYMLYGAFSNCNTLTDVMLSDEINSIGSSAFSGCSRLTNLVMGEFVDFIGESAFKNCTSLIDVVIPNRVTSISVGLFSGCTGLNSITLSIGLTSIGASAFSDCTQLQSVYYLGTVGDWCNIQFSSNLSNPMYYATHFYVLNQDNAYQELTMIEIPDSVTQIGNYQFIGFSQTTKVILPSSITQIGTLAFQNCTKLVEVINLSALSIAKGETTNGYVGYYAINIYTEETENHFVTTENGLMFYNDNGNYYLIGYTGTEANLVLPESIQGQNYAIYDRAFYNCRMLKSVVIPNGVTAIGVSAFENCDALTKVTIGKDVKSIGTAAFRNCTKLVEVINLSALSIAKGETTNGYVGYYAINIYTEETENHFVTTENGLMFYNDNGNYYLIGYTGTEANLVLPESIQGQNYAIYDRAFYNCRMLKSVVIPNGVIAIGVSAFENCDNLAQISIPDSLTKVGERAFYNCTSLQYHIYNQALYLGNEHHPYIILMKASNTSITSCTIHETTTCIYHSAFEGCSALTNIVIPNQVVFIGDSAFEGCNKLKTITMGTGVLEIGDRAFYNCSSLTSIVIPNGVRFIGKSVLYGCNALTSITLPFIGATVTDTENTHFGYIFGAPAATGHSQYVPSTLKTVILTSGKVIGESAFANCSSITSITLPTGLETINSFAFSGCSGLTSITIPDGVTTIGGYAFSGCTGLTAIIIPNSIISIKETAFYSCHNIKYNEYSNAYYLGNKQNAYLVFIKTKNTTLTSCTIHANTKIIYGSAFANCTNLKTITIPNNVISIGNSAFSGCTALTSVTFGKNLLSIGEKAFYNCSSLTNVIIPSSVTSIGYAAFQGCKAIQSITIPFVGETIDENTNSHFGYIFGAKSSSDQGNIQYVPSALKTVIVTGSTKLGSYAFSGCQNLTTITLPESIVYIGNAAFKGCLELVTLTIGNNVNYVGPSAFDSCKKLKYANYNNATYLGNDQNPYVILIKADNSLTSYSVHENTKCIYHEAFSGCTNLKTIEMANGVAFIGNNAFSGCKNVTTIELPNAVVTIGERAFYGCTNLTTINIPNSVMSIGRDVFYLCNKLKYNEFGNGLYIGNIENPYLVLVKAKNTNITQCTIHENTKFILDTAFQNCTKLVEVTNLSALSIAKGETTNGYVGYYAINIYTEETENHFVTTENGLMFYNDNGNYYLIGYTGTEANLVLPESIQGQNYVIYGGAFNNCQMLNSVVISKGVTAIGDSAFEDCAYLTSLTISNSVHTIAKGAFYYCNLTQVTYQGTIAEWENTTQKRSLFSTEVTVDCTDGEITYDY